MQKEIFQGILRSCPRALCGLYGKNTSSILLPRYFKKLTNTTRIILHPPPPPKPQISQFCPYPNLILNFSRKKFEVDGIRGHGNSEALFCGRNWKLPKKSAGGRTNSKKYSLKERLPTVAAFHQYAIYEAPFIKLYDNIKKQS